MMFKGFYLISSLLLIAGFSDVSRGESWCHLKLRSTNGTTIFVDYVVYKVPVYRGSGYYYEASHVWFNLSHPSMNGKEKVRAVLLGENRWDESIDFGFESKRFTASIQGYLPIEQFGYDNSHVRDWVYEVAFVVDGEWLKDPISQKSNFQLDFRDFPGYCANRD